MASFCSVGFGSGNPSTLGASPTTTAAKNTTTILGTCTLASSPGVLTIEATTTKANVFDLNDPPVDKPGNADAKVVALNTINGIILRGNFGVTTTDAIGLEITNTSASAIVLNLTKKFIINSTATIQGSKSGFVLNGSLTIINADIENSGTIGGGVVIGESNKTAFPLRPGADTTTHKVVFTNTGKVTGGFDIKGKQAESTTNNGVTANAVATFELVNNSANASSITGDITLGSGSNITFKLTNTKGTISSDKITVTEINNSGDIGKNSTSLTITATELTNTGANATITATDINGSGAASKITNTSGGKITANAINKNNTLNIINKGNNSTITVTTKITATEISNTDGTITAQEIESDIDNSGKIGDSTAVTTITATEITNTSGGQITATTIGDKTTKPNIINKDSGSTITANTINATNIDNSGTINGDSSAASTITATNIKNSKNITKGGGKLTI
ncbi:Hypothetical predicted protein, partial [Paramuricea clavata]